MRLVAGFLTFVGIVVTTGAAAPPSDPAPLNTAVLKYCKSHEGKRVGSGECSHLAQEALRSAGAEFTQVGADGQKIPNSPGEGDYVWGTLIKTYSIDEKKVIVVDSEPKKKCRPGDILQLRNVKLVDRYSYEHHTAVVAEVDQLGHPATVYQQNFRPPGGGDGRVVYRFPMTPIGLLQGRIMVYRPEAATNPATLQFTLTNTTKDDPVEFSFNGKTDKLGAANTAGGYRYVWLSGKGTITVAGKDFPLETRKGYEFYTAKDGKNALREAR